MDLQADGQTIKTTISLGLTTYTPEAARVGKSEIIATADKALYHSKNGGRNRISVLKLGR
jgi:diguanylate cyclase